MQAEMSDRLKAEKEAASSKQEMLAPMIRRLAQAELARGGLVFLKVPSSLSPC